MYFVTATDGAATTAQNNDGAASEANPLLFGRHGDAECFVEGQRNVPVEGATRIRNGSGQTVSSR
jgi:hypothetical protein